MIPTHGGVTVTQLHKLLGKLVGEGKGSYVVTIGEIDGSTIDIGYVDVVTDEEEIVLT